MANLPPNLKILGLTKLETATYLALGKSPQSTAAGLSKILNTPVESTHQTLSKLKQKNYITSSNEYPKKHQTVPSDLIRINKISESEDALNQLLRLSPSLSETHQSNLIQYIPNRQTYHQISQEQLEKLKNEVLIIASGTGEFEPSFFNALVKINQSNKIHRTVVLSFDTTNTEKLKNWIKNGFQIRYRPGNGINLIIYDRETVQIAVHTVVGSREKQGFLITNKDLANFLAEFHNYLWKNSDIIQ
jgi:sugar-specific transcriptional regulator TrmB